MDFKLHLLMINAYACIYISDVHRASRKICASSPLRTVTVGEKYSMSLETMKPFYNVYSHQVPAVSFLCAPRARTSRLRLRRP